MTNHQFGQSMKLFLIQKTGGVYHILKRVDRHGNIDGFSLVYKNEQINSISDPDDHVVVSCTMNPNNNNEITWYDHSKNSNGKGTPIGHYNSDEDLDIVTEKFFESVLWHVNNR